MPLTSTGLAGGEGVFGSPSGDLLTLVGIPGAGQFRLRIAPEMVPKEEDLQSHLFPSVLAASVDGRGIRIIAREAFPLACTGNRTYLKSTVKWNGGEGLKRDLKLGWKWGTGK